MADQTLKLAALATAAVRGLDVVATRPPQVTTPDFRFCGLLDARGRHWVVQAPLHAAAATALEAEIPILTQLDVAIRDDRLGFDVARPEGVAELPEGGRVMVYRELTGKPLRLEDLTAGPGPAVSLGQSIAQIHELPQELLDAAHAPVYDADAYRRRRLAEVDDAARTSKIPPVLLARWERALEDVALWRFTTCPVHGDLAADNVHMSNGTVSAVLNWSNAHVGDPAEDLAWLYAAAPEASLDTLDEAYAMGREMRPDEHLGSRATLYSELAIARWLLHGVRVGSSEIVADAEQMLHALARQVADSGPIGRAEPVLPELEEDWVQAAGRTAWAVTGSFTDEAEPLDLEEVGRIPEPVSPDEDDDAGMGSGDGTQRDDAGSLLSDALDEDTPGGGEAEETGDDDETADDDETGDADDTTEIRAVESGDH